MGVALGALLWLLAVQFFAAQVIAASAWSTPFDLTVRNISDLGSTACGGQSLAPFCSPWHAVMNASFIAIGVTMSAGALASRPAFVSGWKRDLAVALFTIAGLGVIAVGVFPENENTTVHAVGAGINFLAGNLALIFFGTAFSRTPRHTAFVWFTIAAGAAGLVASALFAAGVDLGFGAGTMERIAAYPMAFWQIAAGLVMVRR